MKCTLTTELMPMCLVMRCHDTLSECTVGLFDCPFEFINGKPDECLSVTEEMWEKILEKDYGDIR